MLLFSCSAAAQVQDGVIDLSKQNDIVELSGDWWFYPDIVSPKDIDTKTQGAHPVPSYWQRDAGLKSYGAGLYHLRVNGVTDELLAIRVGRVHTSYSVWVNDQLIHQSGQPATESEQAKPGIDNKPIVFSSPGESFDLYIGVSNYRHARGGIVKPVHIGEADQLREYWLSAVVTETAMILLIFAIALFTLSLFFTAYRQISYLYFALFCFFSILRLVTIGEVIIGSVFPQTPYSLVAVFRYIGFFISGSFIALYCERLVPTMHGHWIVKFIVGGGVFCTLGVLFAPSWMGTYFSMLFQAVTTISFIGFYFLLVKAISQGRRDLILVGLSITSIVIGFTHDVLVVIELVPWHFWQVYGFVFATAFQLLFFLIEYKSLNDKVDSLHASFTSLGIIQREKDELEKVLINEIKGQLNKEEKDEDFLKRVLKKINMGPSIPASQKTTIESIEKVSQDFHIKLKRQYPDLTQKEYELCLSLKAKLSTKEIAAIRNMTTDSVKKARSRLRQKLNLEKGKDLYQFFESF